MNWIEVLKILGPAVLAVTPGAQPFIPLVIAGIELAEKTGEPGASKRAIGEESVVLGAQAANTIAKKEVVNAVEAAGVYNDVVDSVVGVVNLVAKAKDSKADQK